MALGNFGLVPNRLRKKLKRAYDRQTTELHERMHDHHHHKKPHKHRGLPHQHTNKEFSSSHQRGRRESEAKRVNKDGLFEKDGKDGHHPPPSPPPPP